MVQRILYYAITCSIWQQGIGLMIRRSVVLSSNQNTESTEWLTSLIQDDINKIIQTDNKTVVLDRYTHDKYRSFVPEDDFNISAYDGIDIHYALYDGTNETSMVTCKDYLDITKTTPTVSEKCDEFTNYVPTAFGSLNSTTNVTIHYLITCEQFYDDSYPEFVSGKIVVTTYDEFDTFMKEQMKNFASSFSRNWNGIQSKMAHYFIEGQTQWERWM